MKQPTATSAQRNRTLRNIRHAEAAMLPPGWDKGLEHQFGTTLTEIATQQAQATADEQGPISLAGPRADRCPPGLCTQHNPACAGHCRYREAAQALASERQPMPQPTARRERLLALAHWMLVALLCAGIALTWITTPDPSESLPMTTIHLLITPGRAGAPPIILSHAVNERGVEIDTKTAITASTDTAMVARAMLQSAAYLFAQGQPVQFGSDIPREVLK